VLQEERLARPGAQGLLSEFPTAPGTCEPSHEGGIGGGVDFYLGAEGRERSNDGGGIRVLDVEGG
jgi:hypothetical protein